MVNPNYKVCDECGNLVDNNNILNIHGKELCKSCIEKKLEQKETFSPLTTFIYSLIPGVAHIYLGKKQKGLFLLIMFLINIPIFSMFILCYFLVIDEILFLEIIFNTLLILLPILEIFIYLYSFFDANISRKYIENNSYIDGFIDKLYNKTFNKKNKKYLENKIIDKRLQ